jgi:hypothetical protein
MIRGVMMAREGGAMRESLPQFVIRHSSFVIRHSSFIREPNP